MQPTVSDKNITAADEKGMNFDMLAKAVLLFWREKDSLFLDQKLSEILAVSPDVIREKIRNMTGIEPEQLVSTLRPDRVKQIVSETAKSINEGQAAKSNIYIEAMTEAEIANSSENILINYSFADTPFGPVIIASTSKGVCYLAFADEGDEEAYQKLSKRFPKAAYRKTTDDFQSSALIFFENKKGSQESIQLHVKGTRFQIKTWKKLAEIPAGGLMSYQALTDDPKKSHALGAAVGSNPVAYIIPCHRAVHTSGEFGQYHWGKGRKAALICLEATNYSR